MPTLETGALFRNGLQRTSSLTLAYRCDLVEVRSCAAEFSGTWTGVGCPDTDGDPMEGPEGTHAKCCAASALPSPLNRISSVRCVKAGRLVGKASEADPEFVLMFGIVGYCGIDQELALQNCS